MRGEVAQQARWRKCVCDVCVRMSESDRGHGDPSEGHGCAVVFRGDEGLRQHRAHGAGNEGVDSRAIFEGNLGHL